MFEKISNAHSYKTVVKYCNKFILIPLAPSTITTFLLLGASFFVILAGSVFVAYLSTVQNFGFEPGDLGTLGDFVGGLLNPFLTFISIGFIAYTLLQNSDALKISSDELKLTREEMELARVEHAKSAKAHEKLVLIERDTVNAHARMASAEFIGRELDVRIESLEKKLGANSFSIHGSSRASLNEIEIKINNYGMSAVGKGLDPSVTPKPNDYFLAICLDAKRLFDRQYELCDLIGFDKIACYQIPTLRILDTLVFCADRLSVVEKSQSTHRNEYRLRDQDNIKNEISFIKNYKIILEISINGTLEPRPDN